MEPEATLSQFDLVKSGSSQLVPDDFSVAFGEKLSDYVSERIRDYDFKYRLLDRDERDKCLRLIVDAICNGRLVVAGDQRINQWETGWGSHVDRIEANFDLSAIIPGYFGKYPIVRWRQDLIQPLDSRYEYRSFAVIQDWLFDKYLREFATVYEFGCGTGHNLFRVRDVNPRAALWGLDWTEASQRIIARINHLGVDHGLHGHRFNLVDPDSEFVLEPDAAVYTAASLEQIGDRFRPFVEYLLRNRPALCIHIEPIAELLDENNLLDFLSVTYFKRRNYLSGFLGYLRELEREGRIDIHLARRTMIGSLFIEGYSVIVWSPKETSQP